jgi:DNA primase
MDGQRISCNEARQMDLVDYLATLGHQPQKVRGADHWYLSPFREEKTPSFKVNKTFNIWYDHGIGKGGNLVDFGILYHQCTVKEFLQRLDRQPHSHDAATSLQKEPAETKPRINILSVSEIGSAALERYLDFRKIPLEVARKHCRQVEFELYGKRNVALGFPNRSGGYELRNANFKGSSSPKDISFIDNRTSQVAVFEGFFNYLSFLTINKNQEAPLSNCLILNSLAFLEKSRPLMEKYDRIHLVLDNDAAGKMHTRKALGWSDKYIDRSEFYSHHKDLNEWLKSNRQELRQQLRRGRSI